MAQIPKGGTLVPGGTTFPVIREVVYVATFAGLAGLDVSQLYAGMLGVAGDQPGVVYQLWDLTPTWVQILPTPVRISARVASTANVGTLFGNLTIDAVVLSNGDRVLLKNQATTSQNGLWVASAGAWVRPADFATGSSAAGTMVIVREGTTQQDTTWLCTTNPPIDLVDLFSIAWAQQGASFSATIPVTVGTITGTPGAASTSARSDHRHAIDLTMAPTWTGVHVFGNNITFGSLSTHIMSFVARVGSALGLRFQANGGTITLSADTPASGSGIAGTPVQLSAGTGADATTVAAGTGGHLTQQAGRGGQGSATRSGTNGGTAFLFGGSSPNPPAANNQGNCGGVDIQTGTVGGNPFSGAGGQVSSGGSISIFVNNATTVNGGVWTPGLAGSITSTAGRGGGVGGSASAGTGTPNIGGKHLSIGGIGGASQAAALSHNAANGGDNETRGGQGGDASGTKNPGNGGHALWTGGDVGVGGTGNGNGGDCVATPGLHGGTGTPGEVKLALTRGTVQIGGAGRMTKINPPLTVVAGSILASASTIAPTAAIHHVSGSAAIGTITIPYTGFVGTITLIPDGAWTWTVGGNIGTTGTATIGRPVQFTYDGTLWWA